MNLYGKAIGPEHTIFIIAGPCVIENYEVAIRVAESLAALSRKHEILIIYKSSFYKDNRTSYNSYRGPGLDKGLEILFRIKQETGLPLTTDIHFPDQVAPVSEIVDLIQVPAFLGRQSSMIEAAAKSSRPVHYKKPQFMDHHDVKFLKEKAEQAAIAAGRTTDRFFIGERGSCFGPNNLVVDMRGIQIMQKIGMPVIFDASHSTLLSPRNDTQLIEDHLFTPLLARCAAAAGVAGIFIETHPSPRTALCDARSQLPLESLHDLLPTLKAIDDLVKTKALFSLLPEGF